MTETVIKIENLSKKYVIAHQRQGRYQTFRETMVAQVKDWRRQLLHPFFKSGEPLSFADDKKSFYALNDVSLEIKRGDRVGIIGRNGAGKSTLLKILSRITEPTCGRIEIDGRVASLLEVGTGFHPELTGRENIFLNGAILGMTRKEIRRKFDEIVSFAEIEKFIDTPVKRYSSGMYVRLAFAVAAHLEPEILIVDEVLAVGDAQFQKKCLGRMEAVGKEGRTVLFVSHNMAAVSNLCNRGIYLNEGSVAKIGNVADVIKTYFQKTEIRVATPLLERMDRRGSGIVRFAFIEVLDSEGVHTNNPVCGKSMTIRIKLASETNGVVLKNPIIAVGIDDSAGQRILHLSNESSGESFHSLDVENESIYIEIPKLQLCPGSYTIVLFLSSNGVIVDWIQNAFRMQVDMADYYGSGKLPPSGQGFFLADYSVGLKADHV